MTNLNEIESGVDRRPNPPPKFIEQIGKALKKSPLMMMIQKFNTFN